MPDFGDDYEGLSAGHKNHRYDDTTINNQPESLQVDNDNVAHSSSDSNGYSNRNVSAL